VLSELEKKKFQDYFTAIPGDQIGEKNTVVALVAISENKIW
jgi:hypothetical protein